MGSAEKVTQIYNQTIHGDVGSLTSVSNYGEGASINVAIGIDDKDGFVEFLVSKGFPKVDMEEFADILSTEESGSAEEPFGAKAKEWFVENIIKAASGTWNVGVSVATQLLTEAALRFYGLK